MAMMISKFHRLIQNKITWWIALVVIIFSFVVWGSGAGSRSDSAQNTAIAQLEGKPIEQPEYRNAYNFTHLGLILTYGREIPINPQVDEYLKKAAWQRIASLHEAAKFGIQASDDEVAGFQQQLPFFRTKEGQFSPQAYEQFVGQFLPRMGIGKLGFDDFVREEIILQKANVLISRLLLVSPYDARRTFHALNDRFVLEIAEIGADKVEKDVKAGRDEAKALFDRDPTAYKIPDMVKVNYIRIPFSNFTAQIEVKDESIKQYYDAHLDEYALPSTNANKAAATNMEFSTEVTKYKTLEEVRGDIVKALKDLGAADAAKTNIIEFVDAIQGSGTNRSLSFGEAARKLGHVIKTTKPFSEMGDIAELRVGPDFNRAAFRLENSEGLNVSEPVEGADAWYVLAYADRIPERVPLFEEVLDKVLPDARDKAIGDAMTALAKKTRDAMETAAKQGKSVAEAAKAFGIELKKTEPFSASTGSDQKIEHFDVLIRSVLPHNAGEVTDLLDSKSGKILVAHVAERLPADEATFGALRQQIASSIRRQQGRMLFEGWQAHLLERGNFNDLLKKATAGAAEEI